MAEPSESPVCDVTSDRDVDLLTPDEQRAMETTAHLASLLHGIAIPPGATTDDDWNEICMHLHAIQNMILAQAAARAYPGKYRLMGAVSAQ